MNTCDRVEEHWLRILDFPGIPEACHGLAAENSLVRDVYIIPPERWAGTITASQVS